MTELSRIPQLHETAHPLASISAQETIDRLLVGLKGYFGERVQLVTLFDSSLAIVLDGETSGVLSQEINNGYALNTRGKVAVGVESIYRHEQINPVFDSVESLEAFLQEKFGDRVSIKSQEKLEPSNPNSASFGALLLDGDKGAVLSRATKEGFVLSYYGEVALFLACKHGAGAVNRELIDNVMQGHLAI